MVQSPTQEDIAMNAKEPSIYDLIDRINISETEKAAAKAQIRKIELIGDFIGSVSTGIGRGFRALRLKLQPAKHSVEFEG